jgi:hypothetical protein
LTVTSESGKQKTTTEVDIGVSVDMLRLARLLGPKALRAKKRRSVMQRGIITVTAVPVT